MEVAEESVSQHENRLIKIILRIEKKILDKK